MAIVIIDDSIVALHFMSDMLRDSGYKEIILAESLDEAFVRMGVDAPEAAAPAIELVLMDIHMPGKDGLQGCRELKALPRFEDVPIIIITGSTPVVTIEAAFGAGAMDFIAKPPVRIELLARVRSALKLRQEMIRRKEREADLVALTGKLEGMYAELQLLSSLDALTGVANRHCFNEHLDREWRRACRNSSLLSIIMIDIDFFKSYNDTYGHLEGDNCLVKVAGSMRRQLRRPADLLARFGGEEFIAVLPETDLAGTLAVAETMLAGVRELGIRHKSSGVCNCVTVSMGVSCTVPTRETETSLLIETADRALYRAKQEGRNRVCSLPVPVSRKPVADTVGFPKLDSPGDLLSAFQPIT